MGKKEKKLDDFLKSEKFDTRDFLEGITLPEETPDISVEEILAEYGAETVKPKKEDLEENLNNPWHNDGDSPEPEIKIYKRTPKRTPPPQEADEGAEYVKAAEKSRPAKPKSEPAESAVPDKPAEQPKAEEQPLPRESFASATGRVVEINVRAKTSEESPKPPKKSKSHAKPAAKSVSVENVVADVVDTVMVEEAEKREVAQPRLAGRGLFSGKKFEDTEPFFEPAPSDSEPEDLREDWEIEPERDSEDAARDYHEQYKRIRKRMPLMYILSALMAGVAVADYEGWITQYIPQLTAAHTALLLLAFTLIACVAGSCVFAHGFGSLFRKKCTPELLASISCIVAMADCASVQLFADRCANMPFAPVTVVTLMFIMRGRMLRLRGLRDTCSMCGFGKDAYAVGAVEGGIRKQRSEPDGYIRLSEQDSPTEEWYRLLLPIVFAASLVFAVLASVGQSRPHDFFWCWSAILTAACAMPLAYVFGAPLAKMAQRLKKEGCGVAGYLGAEIIGRDTKMILTDGDLFPPGTVNLNGMRVYSENPSVAISHAASLVRESGSGLTRIFDELLRTQGGHIEKLNDFSFYKEGGFSADINGEFVVLGSYDFMARMGVRLPKELTKMKTAVLLSVDKQLTAVFAVKYLPSDNVDTAIRILLKNRVTLVFAVRDANITPSLIKRKFKLKRKCVFPELSDRIALSEVESEVHGYASGVIFREGLLPFAEVMIAAKRLVSAVRVGTAVALLGSITGTFISFYLAFIGSSDVLSPLLMLVFLLLWTVPAIMISGWVNRY